VEAPICSSPGICDWRPSRGAVRYPLHLRVTLLADNRDYEALTEDLSASGVLFRLQKPLREESHIDFLLEIPAETLEFSVTAAVHCSGRIVRSYWKHGQAFSAAVIDEYRFQ
jgi:PilZ domain